MGEEELQSLEVLISKEWYDRLVQRAREVKGGRYRGRRRQGLHSAMSMLVENALREYLDKPESFTVAAEK